MPTFPHSPASTEGGVGAATYLDALVTPTADVAGLKTGTAAGDANAAAVRVWGVSGEEASKVFPSRRAVVPSKDEAV